MRHVWRLFYAIAMLPPRQSLDAAAFTVAAFLMRPLSTPRHVTVFALR